MGNAMFTCSVHSAHKRSFEEVSGEMEVGKRSLLPPLALEPRPLPPLGTGAADTPTSTQTEPQVEPATSAGVILPETGQFLLLCSLHLWQQLQRCRQTRSRFQVFWRILFPLYGNSLPRTIRFLGKRTAQVSAHIKKRTADVCVAGKHRSWPLQCVNAGSRQRRPTSTTARRFSWWWDSKEIR